MDKHEQSREIDLSFFWKVLRKRWIFLLLALLIGMGGAFVYSKTIATPIYSCQAQFMVTNTMASVSATTASYQQGAERYASNFPLVIEGSDFRDSVLKAYEDQVGKRVYGASASARYVTDSPVFSITVRSTDKDEAYDLLVVYQDLIPQIPVRYWENASQYLEVSLFDSSKGAAQISPNVSRNMLVGGAAMALLTYFVFFLAAFLDKTVYSDETLRERFELPILGSIPAWLRPGDNAKEMAQRKRKLRAELKNGHASERDITGRLLDKNTPFAISEAFKSLRTNLAYIGGAKAETPVFGVVSDFAGTGKSMLSSNIALSFSQLGKRVLLIDGDMHRPILYKIFNIPRTETGIAELLAGITQKSLEECAHATQYPGLDVLICGRNAPNSAELLSTERMQSLLKEAKEKYDYIFIDLPPLCAASDAGVLASLLDGYVLVARAGFSNISAIRDSVETLQTVNGNIVGFVVNDVESYRDSYYYSSRSQYGKYYANSLDGDKKAKK